jgi:hypothetical protein
MSVLPPTASMVMAAIMAVVLRIVMASVLLLLCISSARSGVNLG